MQRESVDSRDGVPGERSEPGWTARGRVRRRVRMRIEDDIRVTKDGYELLTHARKDNWIV